MFFLAEILPQTLNFADGLGGGLVLVKMRGEGVSKGLGTRV